MVGERPLFDTNILIDYTRGIPEARKEFLRYSDLSISIITWIEVLAGLQPSQQSIARDLLSTFTIRPLTDTIAEQAILFRHLFRIKLPDAIILATAEIHDLVLVTRNTRDFSNTTPRVRVPYRI